MPAPVSSAIVRKAGPILIAVIGLFALVIDFWPNLYIPTLQQGEAARRVETKLGLDLQGGLKVEYRVLPTEDRAPTLADVNVEKGIIERRVNATGVAEPVVVTSGTDRIVVEVPGISDTAAIRRLVGQIGLLQFAPIPSSMTPPGPQTPLDLTDAPACPTTGSPAEPCVLFTGAELAPGSAN